MPLVQRVAVYDLRDRLYTTNAAPGAAAKNEVLTVQTREGLTIGLAISVRYRLDPQRLGYIDANLAQPVDTEIVAPVVSTAFRDLAPNYVVREVFSTKRDEFRAKIHQDHHRPPRRRRHPRQGSPAARRSPARGVRQGPRRNSPEGAGKRTHGI